MELDPTDAEAWTETARVHLRLGDDQVMPDCLARTFREKKPFWWSAHVEARYSPEFDRLRGKARFEQLLRDNLPPGAKPMREDQAPPR
jgi:hypothetical protein